LDLAVRRLEEVGTSESYGVSLAELRDTAFALQVASDFIQLAYVLSDDPMPQMAAEVALAVRGNLEGTAKRRKPKEFQSQFWVGTLLAYSGLQPRVPPSREDQSQVDFVIEVDTLQYAVEVKRPETLRSVTGAMDRAAGQTRDFGLPGVLVIDLSDCFGASQLTTAALDHHTGLREMLSPHFRAQVNQFAPRVLYYKHSDKYKRVAATVFFIRLVGWRRADMRQPESVVLFNTTGYPMACGGLIDHHTDRLRGMIRRGCESLGEGLPVLWEDGA
jgi:hypothetical protein